MWLDNLTTQLEVFDSFKIPKRTILTKIYPNAILPVNALVLLELILLAHSPRRKVRNTEGAPSTAVPELKTQGVPYLEQSLGMARVGPLSSPC